MRLIKFYDGPLAKTWTFQGDNAFIFSVLLIVLFFTIRIRYCILHLTYNIWHTKFPTNKKQQYFYWFYTSLSLLCLECFCLNLRNKVFIAETKLLFVYQGSELQSIVFLSDFNQRDCCGTHFINKCLQLSSIERIKKFCFQLLKCKLARHKGLALYILFYKKVYAMSVSTSRFLYIFLTNFLGI